MAMSANKGGIQENSDIKRKNNWKWILLLALIVLLVIAGYEFMKAKQQFSPESNNPESLNNIDWKITKPSNSPDSTTVKSNLKEIVNYQVLFRPKEKGAVLIHFSDNTSVTLSDLSAADIAAIIAILNCTYRYYDIQNKEVRGTNEIKAF